MIPALLSVLQFSKSILKCYVSFDPHHHPASWGVGAIISPCFTDAGAKTEGEQNIKLPKTLGTGGRGVSKGRSELQFTQIHQGDKSEV